MALYDAVAEVLRLWLPSPPVEETLLQTFALLALFCVLMVVVVAMIASRSFNVWTATVGMAALALAAHGALLGVGAANGSGAATLLAPVVVAGATGSLFPLLEAVCMGEWRYAATEALPGLGVPPWLFPLWAPVAAALVQVGRSSRVLLIPN